tara:strand:+ start:578 stop:1147 length:570 start_codon:yes stop_codon:yes gene_type:complete
METLKQFRQICFNHISDTRLIPIFFALAILVFFDVSNRLIPLKQIEISRGTEQSNKKVSVQRLHSERYQIYLEKLHGSGTSTDPLGAKLDPTGEGLDSLTSKETDYIDIDKGFWSAEKASYRLVAVLRGDELFAVLECVERASGIKTHISVRPGDQTDDFTVTDIRMNAIKIYSKLDGEIVLKMFDRRD